MVIDLRELNGTVVSPDKQFVSVDAGAQWQDIYKTAESHDVMVNGGRVWGIGAGGFLTGGEDPLNVMDLKDPCHQ